MSNFYNIKRFLIVIFIGLPIIVNAHDIQGKVLDELNNPIIGANIIHLKSDHHSHTNELGLFSLGGVEEGDTILITHLGFKSKKIAIESIHQEFIVTLETQIFQLDEIIVGRSVKNLNHISKIDITIDPVNSSQEILQKVPGLFIGQHAGGGKAEQIFLRGFDIDHGTDINITVDGMPVNMVSHAHGQGYSDLHFLIPETIENFDFGKGPYYADKGNFTTAGYVNFVTKERLDQSSIQLGLGRFNTQRMLGLFDLVNTEHNSAYVATEFISTDGPFESSQDFNRLNLMGKYMFKLSELDKILITASHFTSQWDASGQIPIRAVESGKISRFGAIDDTEGGTTSRTNLSIAYNKALDVNTFIKNSFYYSLYDFELYSNFTFFLRDPVNGDQIRQKEDRAIYGFESEWSKSLVLGPASTLIQAGIGIRHDEINDNELSATFNRKETLKEFSLGQIRETNFFGYGSVDFDFGKYLINLGLRIDRFNFKYQDELATNYDLISKSKTLVSPKLNFIYNLSQGLQLYAKGGIGFHSNDSRVILNNQMGTIIPSAYGIDLGMTWKPAKRLIVNGALWYLFLQQEFVYVGDEGIVEPSGRSKRLGIDFGLRYQVADWLFFDSDITYAYARSIDVTEGSDFIPLAPDLTFTGGVGILHKRLSGGIHFRLLNDRPANEDNSIIADGYFITDLNLNYHLNSITLGIAIENLFNNEWNETQFATTSRLRDESSTVEEIHFTPGIPFYLKGIVKYTF